jgi:hypothetical protein
MQYSITPPLRHSSPLQEKTPPPVAEGLLGWEDKLAATSA